MTTNALVFTEKEGIKYASVEPQKIPQGSQPFFVEWLGLWMHLLIQRDNHYERFEQIDYIEQTPAELMEAATLPDIAAALEGHKGILEKVAFGAIVAVIIAGMVLLFAFSNGGGA
jgi:hypothetical protein